MRVCAAAVLGIVCFAAGRAPQASSVVRLAEIGPWPTVSGLIGYGDRLWLVNSVRASDHNSADVYSYDPRSGAVRYERHLFSQDAGRPTVAGGILYWPFEDPRFSAGRGEYMATNGRDWQWRELAGEAVLHVHAMLGRAEALFAATGGFAAGLQRSDDGGRSWRIVYTHRSPAGVLSRLLSLGTLGNALYAGLYSPDEPGVKLLRLRGGTLVPVSGWPNGESADALTPFGDWLYALHSGSDGPRMWRSDGVRSEPVAALAAVRTQALASGSDALWAVSATDRGGALWRSRDGVAWEQLQRFDGDIPVDVAVHGRHVYVGATGASGRGALYGPAAPASPEPALPLKRLAAPKAGSDATPLPRLLAALDRALDDVPAFEARGGRLVALLDPIVALGSAQAAEALAARIGSVPATAATSRFAGRAVCSRGKVDWLLLRAIAQIGRGRVPVDALGRPWSARAHRSEKYVEAVVGVAWALGEIGQRDGATIDAVLARLAQPGDPPWLAGDLIGALTVLSGCRFGNDLRAWRRWRAGRVPCTAELRAATPGPSALSDLVSIPGGAFEMGDIAGEPDEAPREARVAPFRLMRREVTNRDFAEFIAATGYITDPERRGAGFVWTDTWREVRGAEWRRPAGPESSISGLDDHPVVQVSARDAAAYCAWRGLRLPAEHEWEFAARGPSGRRYPWGDDRPVQRGVPRANFGADRCCAPDASDGYARTAPVGTYPEGASPFGVLDLAGNVWEWTASPYRAASGDIALRGGGWGNDAYGLRAAYRHGNPPDIGLDMVGFRCAGD